MRAMRDLQAMLEKLGLSQKEAIVYLALLVLGRASLLMITRQAKLPRSTVHHALRALCDQGLLVIEMVEGKRMYQLEVPERLRTLIHMQQQTLDEQSRVVETVLPRLRALAKGRTRPAIRYIESVEGLQRMQSEIELMSEDIIQIIGFDAFKLLYHEQEKRGHRKELGQNGRRIRSIIISSSTVNLPEVGFEYCILPPELAPIEGEMSVCGDRLMLFSYADGIIAIDIQSKTLATTARATLEFAWQEAKRLVPVQGVRYEQAPQRNKGQ